MKSAPTFFLLTVTLFFVACNQCDSNQATNKMLALGKVSARMAGNGGEGLANIAAALSVDSGVVSELIAQGDFSGACKRADEIEAKYKLDLASEQKGMLTIEQLTKDGGKGTGSCSISEASIKQMEIHSQIQAAIASGQKPADSINRFSDKTMKFGELLVSDPSKACELLEQVKRELEL